jgi:hypothetical protein
MTLVRDRNYHELGVRRRGVAAAGDATGALGGGEFGGDQLRSLGGPAANQDVMSSCSKSSGKATTLGSRAAEDAYLHPANVLALPG